MVTSSGAGSGLAASPDAPGAMSARGAAEPTRLRTYARPYAGRLGAKRSIKAFSTLATIVNAGSKTLPTS